MTFSGKMPTASSFTMTAGRVFCISAPNVGERLMSQISPRRMELLGVQGTEGGQFGVALVVGKECLGSRDQLRLRGPGLPLLLQEDCEGFVDLKLLLKWQLLNFTDDFGARHV